MLQPAENSACPIVGAWLIDIFGAPFVPHVAIFHADGTFLIHNPEAGDRGSSDSLGVGAWELDQEYPTVIVGQFQEINADRFHGQYVSRLVVDLTLTMQGTDVVCGEATAAYFTPEGTPQSGAPLAVTLKGTRIRPGPRTRERREQTTHQAVGTL